MFKKILKFLFRVWKFIGLVLGTVVGTILSIVLYLVFITPFAVLIVPLTDYLHRRKNISTLWLPHKTLSSSLNELKKEY